MGDRRVVPFVVFGVGTMCYRLLYLGCAYKFGCILLCSCSQEQ
jgi:hypothetical protein